MLLALLATAVVIVALMWEIGRPRVEGMLERRRVRRRAAVTVGYDPGRERRAEQRARQLLKSCVNEEEWEMYRDLGLIRVWGREAHPDGAPHGPGVGERHGGAPYAYLLYPHRPIVAYVPQTGRLLSEYCVEFPDETRPYGSALLPESDDMLAKWMALTGDERRLVASANMHLPGRQLDPERVRRDLWRLGEWERARARRRAGSTVPAP